jgi:hypothetical protein
MGNLSASDLNLLPKWSIFREAEHSKNVQPQTDLTESTKGSLAQGRNSAWGRSQRCTIILASSRGSDVGPVTSHHITPSLCMMKDSTHSQRIIYLQLGATTGPSTCPVPPSRQVINDEHITWQHARPLHHQQPIERLTILAWCSISPMQISTILA